MARAPSSARLVLLDNEAIGALADPHHPKRRAALAVVEAVADHHRRGLRSELAVPTAVRVEAGWDRRAPRAATINRLRIRDIDLRGPEADLAAVLAQRHRVSVPDAHLGAAIATPQQDTAIAVVTSDPRDIMAIAGDRAISVHRI